MIGTAIHRENQFDAADQRAMTIYINGEKVIENFDVLKKAGGPNKAADLFYNNIEPQNGIIAVQLAGSKLRGCQRDALPQAIDGAPGEDGKGSDPQRVSPAAASGSHQN